MAPTVDLGPFALDRPIGQGAMGAVWAGKHVRTGLPVAVKVLVGARVKHPKVHALFRREVRAVAALDHPGVVQVYDHGVVPRKAATPATGFVAGAPYLVMEYIQGKPLQQLPAPADWAQVHRFVDALLDALAHAHARGVLHLDVKPANVLIRTGRRTSPVLVDFGIARLMGDLMPVGVDRRSEGPRRAGTPYYMAPELIEGAWRDQGAWTDLYALASLTWQLVIGQPPFRGSSEEVMRAHTSAPLPAATPRFPVPPGLIGWLHTALAKAPDARFPTAAAARQALSELGDPAEAVVGFPAVAEPEADPAALALDTPVDRPRTWPTLPPPRTWRVDTEDDSVLPFASANAQVRLPDVGLGLVGLRPMPLVGRTAERDHLWARLCEASRERSPRAVQLVGAAGTGKSRLAGWLAGRTAELGCARVVRVGHTRRGGGLDGLSAGICRALGCADLAQAEIVTRLAHRLGPEDTPGSWERLARLLAGTSGDSLHHKERKALLVEVLCRMSLSGTVVLWIDDAQWGLESIAIAHALLQTAEAGPVLSVLTVRSEALARAPEALVALDALDGHAAATRLALSPLTDGESRALVRNLLGLAPELAARVASRAAGNPLFAVQLVQGWASQGALLPGPRGFELLPSATTRPPDDLTDIWRQRLEPLLTRADPRRGQAMELAAVLGTRVAGDEWAAACKAVGLDVPNDLVETMASAALLGLDTGRTGALDAAPSFSFAHGLLQEALVLRARESGNLTRWHRAAAAALRALGQPGVEDRLGTHLLDADAPAEALDPLGRAVSRLRHQGDYGSALMIVEKWRAALRAADIDSSDLRWGRCLLEELNLLRLSGSYEHSRRLLDRAMAQARSGGWEALMPLLLMQLAEHERMQGQLARALVSGRRAVALLTDDSDPLHRATVTRFLSLLLRTTGESAGAERFARESLAAARQVDDSPALPWALLNLGQILDTRGASDAAEGHFREAVELAARTGATPVQAAGLLELGNAARSQGDLPRAEAQYRDAARLYRRLGHTDALFAELNRAMVLLELERPAEARRRLRPAEQGGPMRALPLVRAVVSAMLAEAAAQESKWDEVAGHLADLAESLSESFVVEIDLARIGRRVAARAQAQGHMHLALQAWHMAADQLQAAGRPDEAAALRAKIDAHRP